MDTPTIKNRQIYKKALSCLKSAYGNNATFRDGQYEAIEATLTHKRTLLVQKTGWGKSLVYFMTTKLNRDAGKGVTVVVSPLLALMENQQEAALKLGLKCECLNSSTRDRREEILNALKNNQLDLVLVTPETLFSPDVQQARPSIQIGLFVVDEAHCISDWGHDFRLEYCRLKNVISSLPNTVPLLATTATANDRVIEDLKKQFGGDVYLSRGHLMRDNLYIQVLSLPDRASRYAWILDNVPELDGTGVIYCLTRRDCDSLAGFLNANGISARAYYSKDGDGDLENQEALKMFMENKIKVLVSTIKLGMGFDKGDISFIIHFQMPANVVSYYQQIGRAGRNIPQAYTFLMTGYEDVDIHEYFLKEAFPEEQEMRRVLEIINKNDGVSTNYISSIINIGASKRDKILAFLLNDGYIYKDGSRYNSIGKPFRYDQEHYDAIRSIRRKEIDQMFDVVNTEECYNKYVINLLNDNVSKKCSFCCNCIGNLWPEDASFESKVIATDYFEGLTIPIEPRKMWPNSVVTRASKIRIPNRIGICLSKYGDPGYGELVQKGKYNNNRFDDKLVDKGAEVLKNLIKINAVEYITFVPSLRSDIVKDYTTRLANKTGLKIIDVINKKSEKPQKQMQNSSYQCANAVLSFYMDENVTVPGKIILVDDIVDSKWTLTVCGDLLCKHGCEYVYPFTLAESTRKDDML